MMFKVGDRVVELSSGRRGVVTSLCGQDLDAGVTYARDPVWVVFRNHGGRALLPTSALELEDNVPTEAQLDLQARIDAAIKLLLDNGYTIGKVQNV